MKIIKFGSRLGEYNSGNRNLIISKSFLLSESDCILSYTWNIEVYLNLALTIEIEVYSSNNSDTILILMHCNNVWKIS